jgi:uncharacterized membrane protein
MSRLLRLYPAAWRDRYRAEMEELISVRPPSISDRLDLARGALDAWVHPQVRRPAPAAGDAGPSRGPLAITLVGAVLFVASGVRIAAVSTLNAEGYRDGGWAFPALVLGMLLTAVAVFLTADERAQRRAAGVAIAGSLMTAMPWPILIIGVFTYVAAIIGLGVLHMSRGRTLGFALIAIGIVLPNFNTEDERALALVPVGVLWVLFALLDRRSAGAAPAAAAKRDAAA